MLPEVSMMKMMYSLSTGTPPMVASSRARRKLLPWSRFISSVSSCWAARSLPSTISFTSESSWVEAYSP